VSRPNFKNPTLVLQPKSYNLT